MIASIVARSLNAAITTDSSGLGGTEALAGVARDVISAALTLPQASGRAISDTMWLIVAHLVILAPNWLGDAVMSLPAIADVRRALPEATIAVAARSGVAPLFALVPEVDEVVPLDGRAARKPSTWRDVGGALRGRGFETAVILPNSFHAAMIASRAAIPERWGFRTDWRGPLLTRAVAPPPRGGHQASYYQTLVSRLGFPNGPPARPIKVPPDVRESGRSILATAGWDGSMPLVALAPGAAYGGAKRWPATYFAELVDELISDRLVPVMIGSPLDTRIGADIETALARPGAVVNLMGRTDLTQLAGVLASCRAIVSNDSGAMHLAAAIGLSVTAIFGPTSERASGPAGDSRILTHEVWCRPCMLRECPLDHRCMRGVGARAVLDVVRRAM